LNKIYLSEFETTAFYWNMHVSLTDIYGSVIRLLVHIILATTKRIKPLTTVWCYM